MYKHVLDGKSTAVFKGQIYVNQIAQKTDSKQSSRTLLLSEDANMQSMPALEIYADDVKCTHGSTIGSGRRRQNLLPSQPRHLPRSRKAPAHLRLRRRHHSADQGRTRPAAPRRTSWRRVVDCRRIFASPTSARMTTHIDDVATAWSLTRSSRIAGRSLSTMVGHECIDARHARRKSPCPTSAGR